VNATISQAESQYSEFTHSECVCVWRPCLCYTACSGWKALERRMSHQLLQLMLSVMMLSVMHCRYATHRAIQLMETYCSHFNGESAVSWEQDVVSCAPKGSVQGHTSQHLFWELPTFLWKENTPKKSQTVLISHSCLMCLCVIDSMIGLTLPVPCWPCFYWWTQQDLTGAVTPQSAHSS